MSDKLHQQINLYRPQQTPVTIGIEFKHMMVIWGVFVLCLGLYTGYLSWQATAAKQDYKVAVEAEKKIQQALSTKIEKEAHGNNEEDLRKKINALIEKRNQASMTLELLLAQGLDHKGGFSPVFDSLAANHVVGTWYSRLKLQQDGRYVELEGNALEPAYVPEIFVALDQDELFEGRGFDSVQLEVDEESKLVKFSMRSQTSR